MDEKEGLMMGGWGMERLEEEQMGAEERFGMAGGYCVKSLC